MSNLKLLFVMEVFSGLSRGSYLICIGWSTLIVTNEVSRVGQAFIVAMLTTLLSGAFVGTIVDRHDRKHLVIFSHLGIALCLLLLGLVWVPGAVPNILWLFAGVAAASALRMMHNASHDGLIQSVVTKAQTINTVARFRAVHLTATAIGTVLAGYIIERFSAPAGFVLSAAASLLLILPMVFFKSSGPVGGGTQRGTFLSDLRGGAAIFAASRPVRLLALLAAVSLPVGQLANAILSSFIRDDLGRGSTAFGIVDSAWPVGGMLAAGLLSLGIRQLTARNAEYLFALLAGLATIGLSLCTTIPMLVLLHGVMGMAVWLCRIVIDGRILEICAPENIGRTKVGVEMAFSVSALVMCLSPTLVALPSTAWYFTFWGAVMAATSALIWSVDKARQTG